MPASRQRETVFCCAGCERVYEVLQSLDEVQGRAYVEAARRLGLIPGGEASAPASPQLPEDPSALRQEKYRIEGLFCPSCAWVLEQVLLAQPGIRQARANFFSGSCLLEYDLRRSSAEQINRILSPLGYRLQPLEQPGQEAERRLTFAFMVSGVLCCNLMSISFLRYAYNLGWISQLPDFLVWLELALTAPILYLGWLPMLRRTWQALKRGRVLMDGLVGLAVGASFFLSLAAMGSRRSDIYFETSAGLVTIFLFSRLVEARLRRQALAGLATLMHMPVQRVRQEAEKDRFRYPPVGEIRPGDQLVFAPEELVPFDGWVSGDRVFVSEAVLSGEPRPVLKGQGDRILAGSTVQEGELLLTVERPYSDTRLFAISETIRQSLEANESRLRSADRIAQWFAPAVLLTAVATWILRAWPHGWPTAWTPAAWFPAVAVLAVACPCAFSLAGITAVSACLGMLLRQGILVKDPAQLERLSGIDALLFDKTGTISQGRLALEQIAWRGGPQPELLGWVAAAEQGSMHPVAQTVLRQAREEGWTIPGGLQGSADIRRQGRRVAGPAGEEFLVGTADLFSSVFDSPAVAPRHTLVWFGFAERAEGCLLLSDPLRPQAAETVHTLTRQGYGCGLISGDRQEVCDWIGRQVGFSTARGRASLEEKVDAVRQQEALGRKTAFIGDGTNDALAMDRATASVALSHGSDEALSAAGFILLSGRLSELPFLFQTGRKLARVIRHNYLWAFSFNTLFIPLAALGYLTPLWAMLLMLASSTAVLLNSLRMRRPAR